MKRKNLLDEMKNQKRLQLESRGLWVAYFGLALVILVQSALGSNNPLGSNGGEMIVMLAVALYLLPNYIRNGIWSTTLKPTFKSNLVISCVVGLAVALFWGMVTYMRFGKLAGSLATATSAFVSMAALTMLLLTLCAQLYKRRIQKLENPLEDDGNASKA